MTAKLPIRIPASQGPVDGPALGVAAPLPGMNLETQGALVLEVLAQALAGQGADLNFRHVQPACMRGRVVELDAAQQLAGAADAKDLLEAGAEVGVQVVDHQVHAARLAMGLLQQVAHEADEAGLAAAPGCGDDPAPRSRFGGHVQIRLARSPGRGSTDSEHLHDLHFRDPPIERRQDMRPVHFARLMQSFGAPLRNQPPILRRHMKPGLLRGDTSLRERSISPFHSCFVICGMSN